MKKPLSLIESVGLHPLVGLGMFAIDQMLFGAEGITLGATLPISLVVAALLTIPCILIQRYGMKDEWGLAIGKGIMVGTLTAIPTSFLSVLPLLGAGFGILVQRKAKQSPINDQNIITTAASTTNSDVSQRNESEKI
jgi:hypothetical protein